jgi:hypothetical protein
LIWSANKNNWFGLAMVDDRPRFSGTIERAGRIEWGDDAD